VTITVVGDRVFGSVDRVLATQSRSLADVAGVDLLAVHFSSHDSNAEFLGTDLLPDVSSPDMAEAIPEYLSGAKVKC